MRRLCLVSSLVSLAVLVLPGRFPALAQGVPEPRGPRFLLASASPAKPPVVVDAGSVASLRRRVSLSLDGARVAEALAELSRVSGLQIVYADGVVPSEGRVHLRAEEITVAAALTEVLLDAGVDVLISPGGSVVLVKRGAVQTGSVAGRVTDANTGQGVAGARVTLDGAGLGALTNDSGGFRIANVPPGSYTLTVRRIGYSQGVGTVAVVADEEAVVEVRLELSASPLDAVVVTGTVVPTEVKALPSPISVVTNEQMQEQNFYRVDQIFRGTIPGVVAWDLGVKDYYSPTPSIRGVTSFSVVPALKTYVDGVEVSVSSFYLGSLDPTDIARVEVIRGPQASTVYGSDASGGVLQIFTKKGTAGDQPRLSGQALVGVMQAPYASGAPLRQRLSLSLTGGRPGFTYHLGGSYLYTGEVAPDYWSRTPTIFGGGSLTQGPVTVELSARYVDRRFSNPRHPQFPTTWAPFSAPTYLVWQLAEQTYGLTVSYQAAARWQHHLTLGYQSEMNHYWQTQPRLRTSADTFLAVYTNPNSKTSVRYNTSYHVPVGSALSLVAIAGAEYSTYDNEYYYSFNTIRTTGGITGTITANSTRYANAGYFGQFQLGVLDRLFVTGGLRAERNDNFGDAYGTAWQPRVGASYVQPLGSVVLKLRSSWGNAIRSVDPSLKQAITTQFFTQLANPNLGPERQSGWDAGVDLQLGRRAAVGVTYYDQEAKDLVDRVTLDQATSPPTIQYQNAGRAKNRGWEFEGHLDLGRVDLSATFSPTKSTIEQLSPTYTGDLRVGERPTGLPVSSAGAMVRWTPFDGTNAVLGMSYVGHWTAIDYIALYGYFYGGDPYRGSTRAYRMEYPSVVKFNLSLTRRLSRRVSALVQVDNLSNNQRYEQYNIIIPAGRVTSVGVRFQ